MPNRMMTRVSLNKSIATILATLLILTAFAVMPVSAENSVPSDRAWGVSYDWSEYGEDVYTLTGLNIDEILAKFTEAAEEAGFEMLIAQLSTGQSMIFIEQTVGEEKTIDDLSGNAHQVTEHITDLTIVNAIMFDMIMMMEWEDPDAGSEDEKLTQQGAGIDITMQFDAELLLSISSKYVEYRTTAGNDIVGADVLTTMDAGIGFGMTHESHWTGGDDTIDINLALSNALGASITDSYAEWRLAEPYDVHDSIDLSVTDEFLWDCNNYYDEFSVNDDEVEEYQGDGQFEVIGVESRVIETPCGSLTGNYASSMNYDFSLSGVPADLLGMDAEVFNIAISDEPTYTGTFEHDDMEFESPYMFNQDKTYNIVIDDAGTQVEAMSFLGTPIPVPHAIMNAAILMHAFEGSEDDPGIANVIEEELGDIMQELEPDTVGHCDYGDTELKLHNYNNGEKDCADGADETFEHVYHCQYSWNEEIPHENVNDGTNDCTYGDDESSNDMNMEFYCDDASTIMLYEANDGTDDCADGSDEIGFTKDHTFTCVDQSATIPVGYVNNGNEECADGSDEGEEIEPTAAVMNVVEHIADSNIDDTLETFGQELEARMTDGSLEPIDFPFTDADGDLLWYDGAPIGFLTFVEEDGNDYIFIGPETEGFEYAPSALGFEYLVGDAVATAVDEVGEIDDISDVIDEEEHDTSAIDGVSDMTIDEAQALATADTDGDGVSNLNDQCPTTPSGNSVGNDGCTVVEDTTTDDTTTDDTTTDDSNNAGEPEPDIVATEDGGMIPSVSFIATLGVLALAGFATSRRD